MHSSGPGGQLPLCAPLSFSQNIHRNPKSSLVLALQALAFISPTPPSLTLAPPDHEELAAAESFNREMAELAELEHQHELRSLLQARITGEQLNSSWNNAHFTAVNWPVG